MAPLSLWFTVFGFSRNAWRFLAALGGIVLAVALVTSANTSFDRAGAAVLWAAFDTTPIDLVLWRSGGEGSVEEALSLAGAISSMEDVDEANVLGMLSGGIEFTVKGASREIYGVFGIDADPTSMLSELGIELGSPPLELSNGEVILSTSALSSVATGTGREPILGQTLPTTAHSHLSGERREWNLSYAGSYQIDYERYWETMRVMHHPSMIVDLQTCKDMIDAMGEDRSGSTIVYMGQRAVSVPDTLVYLVRTDRSDYTPASSLEQFRGGIDSFIRELGAEIGASFLYASPVVYAAESYASEVSETRILFLLASLPAVLLGIYVGITGVETWQVSRRQETALLRSKGLDMGQIRHIVLTECLLVGLVGGVAGVLLGFVLGSIFTMPVPESAGFPAQLEHTGLLPSGVSILVGVLLGIGMAAGTSLRSLRRQEGPTIVEDIGGREEPVSTHYRPRLDIFLVGFPIAVYLLVMVGAQPPGTSLVGALVGILFPVAVALIPLTPIMMTYGLSRILTLSSSRPYCLLARVFSQITGELGPILEEDLARNPRASAGLAVLLALVVAFGTSMLAITASYQQRVRMEEVFSLGSDVKVRLWNLPGDEADGIVSQISLMEGVREVSVTDTHYLGEGTLSMIAISVDPVTLKTCIADNPYYSQEKGRALDLLAQGDDVCLLHGHIDRTGVSDEEVQVPSNMDRESKVLKIVGDVPNMPGTDTLYKATPGTPRILTTHEAVAGILESERRYCLVKLEDPEAAEDMADRIRAMHTTLSEPREVSIASTVEKGALGGRPVLDAVLSYARVEFLFLLLLACLGLGLATYASYRSRIGEVARQIARGVSRGQLATILCVQTLIISIIGIGLGLLSGTVPPYLYSASVARMEGITLLPPFSVPHGFLALAAASLLALFLSSLVASRGAARIDLEKVLRVRR